MGLTPRISTSQPKKEKRWYVVTFLNNRGRVMSLFWEVPLLKFFIPFHELKEHIVDRRGI